MSRLLSGNFLKLGLDFWINLVLVRQSTLFRETFPEFTMCDYEISYPDEDGGKPSTERHALICECKMNVPYYGFIIFIWTMQLVNLIVSISELVTLASLASSETRRQKLLWKALVMLLPARTEENVKRLVTEVSSSFRKWFYYYSLTGLEFEDGCYKLNCLQLMAVEYLGNHLKLPSHR